MNQINAPSSESAKTPRTLTTPKNAKNPKRVQKPKNDCHLTLPAHAPLLLCVVRISSSMIRRGFWVSHSLTSLPVANSANNYCSPLRRRRHSLLPPGNHRTELGVCLYFIHTLRNPIQRIQPRRTSLPNFSRRPTLHQVLSQTAAFARPIRCLQTRRQKLSLEAVSSLHSFTVEFFSFLAPSSLQLLLAAFGCRCFWRSPRRFLTEHHYSSPCSLPGVPWFYVGSMGGYNALIAVQVVEQIDADVIIAQM